MKRRDVIAGIGAGALSLGGCAEEPDCAAEASVGGERFSWKMVTTWPPNFPGVGMGAVRFAESLDRASGGRLKVKVFAAGELVPAFEVFDTVSQGSAEMGHGAAYYWKGKTEASQYFTAIPFGMSAMEMNGWLRYGGGLELYRELYDRFDLVPFPAGNTGVQAGGWFKKEINSIADLEGLKMRIPGLGGEALRKAGGTPVTLPGSEIFTALQTGSIDATEWIGPYNDVAFGLHKARHSGDDPLYYYYPGWQEPGPVLECIVNKEAWASLPEDLQAIVELATAALNDDLTAEYTARNAQALVELRKNPDIDIRPFPDDVLARLSEYTDQAVAEMIARDPSVLRIHESFTAFRESVTDWTAISEKAMLDIRR